MKIRNKLPKRHNPEKECKDYHAYKENLRADFNYHCGYCGDRDWPRKESFEIDHFAPQKIIKKIKENDYFNLVYSCKSCNNAKRAKWVTSNENIPNDGTVGWVDPCDSEYDKQFIRNEDGSIKAVTELGKWMYDNLNLWKRQHAILWELEELDQVFDQMEKYTDNPIIKVLIRQHSLIKDLYNE